jgi:hypothetical protein
MANQEQFKIRLTLNDVDADALERYSKELTQSISDEMPSLAVEREPSRTNTQDLGATLVLILGTPAIIQISKGIYNWLKLRPNAKLVIEDQTGKKTTIVSRSDDMASIVKALPH